MKTTRKIQQYTASVLFAASVPLSIILAYTGELAGYYSHSFVPIAFGIIFGVFLCIGLIFLFAIPSLIDDESSEL